MLFKACLVAMLQLAGLGALDLDYYISNRKLKVTNTVFAKIKKCVREIPL